jgi:hypothetical protein
MELALMPTVHGAEEGAAQDGVAVTSYGKGQLVGTTYTVPAHGQIDVNFKLQLQCVTPDQIKAMNDMIRGLLNASEQKKYDNLNTTKVSGGLSFFAFFSGGLKADTTNVNHTMHSWGLSPKDIAKIVTAMMKLANTMNKFEYKGTIYNKDYSYAVSGNLFGVVMDCTITQGTSQQQVRMIAPDVHLHDSGSGDSLPSVGKLY